MNKFNRLIFSFALVMGVALTGFSQQAVALKHEIRFDLIVEDWDYLEEPAGIGSITIEIPDEVVDNPRRIQAMFDEDKGIHKYIQNNKKQLERQLKALNDKIQSWDETRRKKKIDGFNKYYEKVRGSVQSQTQALVEKAWKKYAKSLGDAGKKILKARLKVTAEVAKGSVKIASSVATAVATSGATAAPAVLISLKSIIDIGKALVEHNKSASKSRTELTKALDEYKKSVGGLKKTLENNEEDFKEAIKNGVEDTELALYQKIVDPSSGKIDGLQDIGIPAITTVLDGAFALLKTGSVKLREAKRDYEAKIAYVTKGADDLGGNVQALLDKLDGLEKEGILKTFLREKGIMKKLPTALNTTLTDLDKLNDELKKAEDLLKEVEDLLKSSGNSTIDKLYEYASTTYDASKASVGIVLGIIGGDFFSVAENGVSLIQAGIKASEI